MDFDHVIRFLRGLDEGYAGVRSQILLMDPFPQINQVFSMVIQHELQMQYVSTNPSFDQVSLSNNALVHTHSLVLQEW